MFEIRWILLSLFSIGILIEKGKSSPYCDLNCLNQTGVYPNPPPLFINDTDHDALVLFSLDCFNVTEDIFVNFSISIEKPQTIEVKHGLMLNSTRLTNETGNFQFNLTVHGEFLGYSYLFVHADYFDETGSTLNLTNDLKIDFAVKRKSTKLDTIFTVVVIILVCIGTFLIGCRLNTNNLYSNLRRPIPILIGLFSQFLFLPLLSFFLAKMTKLDSSTALGVLATGSAPGGGASNLYTALFSGDLDLSASMTFSSTLLAFVAFPLWILLLGQEFINRHNVHFPWENMLSALISLIIPAGIGLVIRWQKPNVANRLTKYLGLLTFIFIIYILTFGVYTNLYIFKLINYRTVLVSAALPYSGFFIGFVLSLITRQNQQRLTAISIESGLQNTGVAIFFLRLSLPQPDSDLAIAVPIFVALAIPIPLFICYLILMVYRRFFLKNSYSELVTDSGNDRDRAEYEHLSSTDSED